MDDQLQQEKLYVMPHGGKKEMFMFMHLPHGTRFLSRPQTEEKFQMEPVLALNLKSVRHAAEIYGAQDFLISCACGSPCLSN